MAFIKQKGIEVGDWIILSKDIRVYSGTFEKGTKVQIISQCERGYDIQDADGNKARELGFDIGAPI